MRAQDERRCDKSREVEIERGRCVARLVLKRPEARDVLTSQVISELGVAIRMVQQADDVAVAVVTAVEPVFSADADLQEIRRLIDDPYAFAEWLPSLRELLSLIEELEKPVIAGMDAPALAGASSWPWPATSWRP